MYVRSMSGSAVREAMANLRAAYDALAACDLDSLTRRRTGVGDRRLETLTCQLPTQWHRLLARLQAETTPAGDGRQVLERRAGDPVAHLDRPKPTRRLHEAAELGRRDQLDRATVGAGAARGGRRAGRRS